MKCNVKINNLKSEYINIYIYIYIYIICVYILIKFKFIQDFCKRFFLGLCLLFFLFQIIKTKTKI